jgi:hypothetical protein
MTTCLTVALDPAIAPFAPEAKYVLRTLLRTAGYACEFTWAGRQTADVYFGPQTATAVATVRIHSCGDLRSVRSGPAPTAYFEQDGLGFASFDDGRSGFSREAGGALLFTNDVVTTCYWLLTGGMETRYPRDRWDNLHIENSFLVRSGIITRPLVSLYAQFLREFFTARGQAPLPLPWQSGGAVAAFSFTHDVDYPEILRGIECLRLLRARGLKAAASIRGILAGSNHFWKFAEWIAFEKKFGTRPAFYFAARHGSLAQYAAGTPDVFYDIGSPRFRELFRQLLDEGCEIGLHASYRAFENPGWIAAERQRLAEISGATIAGGRHHYWRINPAAPEETLARHEAAGFSYDSSLGFEFYPGWRRGICHPFHVFHPGERRELNVLQLPPAWMDDQFDRRLAVNQIASPDEHARGLLDTVRRTGGIAVVDYHQRGMNADFYPRYGPWLTRFLQANLTPEVRALQPRAIARDYADYVRTLDAASTDATRAASAAALAGTEAALEISPMRADEIRVVAQLHFDFFGVGEMHGNSLANLGPGFLADVFYRLNFDNPHFFVDVARYRGEIIAFSVYVSDWRRILSEVIRRHPLAFTARMAANFVRRPLTFSRHAMGNLNYLTESIPAGVKGIAACYLLLGIKDPYRTRAFRQQTGRWVIGEMWERMERTLYDAGCREFWSSPGQHNEPINRLFVKMGTEYVDRAAVQGVVCNFYRKRLQPPADGTAKIATPAPATESATAGGQR